MVSKRLDRFLYKEIPPPFKTEAEQTDAFRSLFQSALGEKVLEQLILDTDYHKPDLPAGVDVLAQLAFNMGKRYVINHIISCIAAEYQGEQEDD